MTRLFLIRHGEPETAWGGTDDDPGLSQAGQTQARAAAEMLAGRGPLAIVSSPMRRCRETAAPYAERRGLEPLIDRRVSEVATPAGVGDRRGWLQSNFPWRDPSARRLWSELDPALRAWRDDMLAYVRGIEHDCAVFTHFIAINVIAGAALARDETIVARPGHASITELELIGGRLLLRRAGAEMGGDDVR
jgi:broad specificity phosphatase PhoE